MRRGIVASNEKRTRGDGTAAFRVVWRDTTQPGRESLTFDDRRQAEQAVKLLDADGQRLTLWIRELRTKGLAHKSISNVHGLLSASMNTAVRLGYRADAPEGSIKVCGQVRQVPWFGRVSPRQFSRTFQRSSVMHPHLRRLSTALALALPLVVTATAAVALDTSATGLSPVQTRASSEAVRADTSAVEHGEMSDPEHAASVDEPAHGEMSDPEHAASVDEPAHGEMSDPEHAQSVEGEHAPGTGSRPRALVLGSFGLVNAGVLVSAAVLRSRTADHQRRRPPVRASAPTAP